MRLLLRSGFWEISRLIAVLTFAIAAAAVVRILKISKLIVVLIFAIAAAAAVKNHIAFSVPCCNGKLTILVSGCAYEGVHFRFSIFCLKTSLKSLQTLTLNFSNN